MVHKLTTDEKVLMQAWLWEHVRNHKGPAHLLVEQNAVDIVQCILVAAPLLPVRHFIPLSQFLWSPQPQIPTTWPWPDKTPAQVLKTLQLRVDANTKPAPIWSPGPVTLMLLIAACLGIFLHGAGAGLLISVPAAIMGTLGIVWLHGEFVALKRRQLLRELGAGTQVATHDLTDNKRRKHNGFVREHEGWDYFIVSPPGYAQSMNCKVCGEAADVIRDIEGRPGYIGFLCGMAEDHDLFVCKHRDETWHRQALELMKAAQATPSQRVRQQLQTELEGILKTRTPTKDTWSAGPHSQGITG